MPFAISGAARLYWRLDGAADKPVLVLLTSIGTDMALYDRAAPYLLPHYRLLRIDTRGHGASDTTPGEYSLDLLADDVAAVMDAAGAESAFVCGISLGGMVAMSLALKHPDRVRGLVLACTSAQLDPAAWRTRIAAVQAGGMGAIEEIVLSRFFSAAFSRQHPEVVDSVRAALLAQSADGYIACGAAIRDMAIIDRLDAIAAPTLVIGSERDQSTPFTGHGDRIAAAVPGAKTALLETAHLAALEAPSAFAALVVDFLDGLRAGDDVAKARAIIFEAGLKNRREVLGDAWVDKALANRTSFNADYQAMITRYAWEEVWGRPGLDHRTRRLIVLAICAALARWEEFGLHVRSGLEQGGFTEDELKELLMQTAIYAGVPAANTGFAEAARIIAELKRETPIG